MMRETRYERDIRRADALRKAEAEGKVADDMRYRLALVKRVHDGEITLEEAQRILKRHKNAAKKNGQLVRGDFF